MVIMPVSFDFRKRISLTARITAHIMAVMELCLADHAREEHDSERTLILPFENGRDQLLESLPMTLTPLTTAVMRW